MLTTPRLIAIAAFMLIDSLTIVRSVCSFGFAEGGPILRATRSVVKPGIILLFRSEVIVLCASTFYQSVSSVFVFLHNAATVRPPTAAWLLPLSYQ